MSTGGNVFGSCENNVVSAESGLVHTGASNTTATQQPCATEATITGTLYGTIIMVTVRGNDMTHEVRPVTSVLGPGEAGWDQWPTA